MADVVLETLAIPINFDLSGLSKGLGQIKSILGDSEKAFSKESEAVDQAEKATKRLRDEKGRFAKASEEARKSSERFGGGLPALGQKLDRLKESLKGVSDRLKSTGEQALKVGGILSAAVTAPILALGKGAVDAATRMDSLRRALTAVSGSSKETEAQLVRLKEIAKLPGLGFEEAVKGSLRLQNAGMSARDAERQLAAFGNAIARAGGGKAELDGVTLALGQIATKGKISQEEINQLVERGINLGPILKKAFGTADTEKLQKAGITTKQFFDAILPELEKLPKVTGGAQNAFENLSDATQQSLAKIGEAILPVLVPLMNKITDGITFIADAFRKLSPDVQQGVIVFAAVAAVIGPLIVAFGAVATAIGTIGVPVAAALAAIALLGAAFATNVGGIRDSVMTVLKPAIDFFVGQFEKVRAWITENMPLIQRTVQTVLQTISEFWREHGQQIMAVVGPLWDAIKTVISTALDTILGLMKTAMQIINGDWAGAWDSLYTTVGNFGNGLMRLLGDIIKGIYNALILMVETTMSLNGRFLSAGISIGSALKNGISQGLRGAWDSMVSSVKEIFGGAVASAGDEFGEGGDFGGPSGSGGADISGINRKFRRTGIGTKSNIPVPTGPRPINIEALLGNNNKKKRQGKTAAERAAEHAKEDTETGQERDANNAVKAQVAEYAALLKTYKEQGGIENLKKLRDLVVKIRALEQGAARVKFDADKDKNPKGAQATYRGEFFGAVDKEKKRNADLDAAKAQRIKLAQKRDADAGIERANQVGKDLDNESQMQLANDLAIADSNFETTSKIIEADENVRIAKLEITRQIQRDTLSRFDFERAELDRTVEKYRQAGVDITTIEAFKTAELARIRGEELKDAQTKADAAARDRVKAESAAARQMKQIFRGVGDDIGRVAEESIEHWKGFKNFFSSLGDSIKATMAKLVANIITTWAKVQLLGGAKAGFTGADGIGGILGSLFGGGKPAPGGAGILPGEQGGVPTGAGAGGALGGLRGLLGAAGPFAAVAALTKIVGPGGLVGKIFKPWGKVMGKVTKIFGFSQGGILPTGVPSIVAEKGTGGEMIVPRTPSMAIPQKVLQQIQGGGSRNHFSMNFEGVKISSEMDIENVSRRVALHVQRHLVTARPEN